MRNKKKMVVIVKKKKKKKKQQQQQQQHVHVSAECGGCGREDRWVLHNVRLRGMYRRLCTNCLLKTHQSLFCPFCFHVYEDDKEEDDEDEEEEDDNEKKKKNKKSERLVMCPKCPSISHLSCHPSSSYPNSLSSFLCPSCFSSSSSSSSSNFSFFLPNHHHQNQNQNQNQNPGLSFDASKALVCAAKLAAISMTKAAALARIEAERRAEEATLAKKRARDALELLAYFPPSIQHLPPLSNTPFSPPLPLKNHQ